MALPTDAKTISFIVSRERSKARSFYAETLGLKLVHEDDFAVVFDMNGVMLRISAQEGFTPKEHTVLGWEVHDIEGAVKTLVEKGVTFKMYTGFGQDSMGIWTVPGGTTKVAWFNDPDGNVLSLTQF